MSRFVLAFALAVITVAAACGSSSSDPPARTSYPDTVDGFDAFARDLVATIKSDRKSAFEARAKQLALPDPDAWFARVFGPTTGARLAVEYRASPFIHFERAWPDLREVVVTKGSSTVTTSRHTDPGDDLATGHQANALREMVKPVALYRLQLTRADGEGSFTLWSFVHDGGTFRLAGKMKQARPIDPTEDMAQELDMLGELPIAEARRMMKEAREGK